MAAPTPLVLAVVNTKGGAGKTTTAVFAAHALRELGRRVLLIDADPQGSAMTWHAAVGLPFAVAALAVPRLHRDVDGIAGDRFDAVIIDTPGTEHGRAIVLSAVRAATHVLIPTAPTPVEYERLRALRTVLDDASDLDAEYEHGVLLVRTISGAASTQVYRDAMTADGWRVLRPAVPRLERFAQAFGEPVVGAAETGYGWAVAELTEETPA